MTGRVATIALLLSGVGGLGGPAAQSQAPPAFRTRTDLVSVNASVWQGRRPVEGLTSADFTLADNGVVQTVTTTGMEAVPLDVTLLIPVGFLSTGNARQYRADVVRMTQRLDAEDRVRVLEYGRAVHEVFPLQRVGSERITERLEQAFTTPSARHWGIPALHDALAIAMILPSSPDRRQLVVAFSNYTDMSSITSPGKLLALAERTEAVLYVQTFRKNRSSSSSLQDTFGRFPFVTWGLADLEHYQADMARVARATGGRADGPSLFGWSMSDFFSDVLSEYRRGYLLQYALAGVEPRGWHDIVVKVTRPGRYDLRSRRGYFVDLPD